MWGGVDNKRQNRFEIRNSIQLLRYHDITMISQLILQNYVWPPNILYYLRNAVIRYTTVMPVLAYFL